jgi:hypothetical protein
VDWPERFRTTRSGLHQSGEHSGDMSSGNNQDHGLCNQKLSIWKGGENDELRETRNTIHRRFSFGDK